MKISRLFPECKDYIWGGEKLKTKYSKHTEKSTCAESWELSFHPDGKTRLSDGRALSDSVSSEELGTRATAYSDFPMLIKLIDARENLSVQVHPTDAYAMENENSYGKTEAWYIVEAEAGAGIYLGFSRDVTRDEYKRAIADGTLTDLLNFYEVSPGEFYFIPAGTVHAIGKGCLIYEIQESSNLTYRVYDYKRRDKHGNERELHIDKALAVSSLSKYEGSDAPIECKYFRARALSVENEAYATDGSTFHAITCVRGAGEIEGERIVAGDSFFIPANYGKYKLSGDMEIILADIPDFIL